MTVRKSSFSVDFVTAEVFAAPFWLPASITQVVTALHPNLSLRRNANSQRTAVLFRATERYLLSQIPAMNLDEFVTLRDRIWYPVSSHGSLEDFGRNEVPLHEVALALANVIREMPGLGTEQYDEVAVASTEPQLFNQDRRFREVRSWLSTALPPDFLESIVAVRASLRGEDRGMRLYRETLTTGGISPSVDHLLRSRGFAETHLHMGAAFRFNDLWVALMQMAGRTEFDLNSMQSPGAEWSEGRGLAYLCLHAAIIRILLAEFLFGVLRVKSDASDAGVEPLHPQLEQWIAHLHHNRRLAEAAVVTGVVRRMLSGKLHSDRLTFRRTQSYYRSLIGRSLHRAVDSTAELHARDPLKHRLPGAVATVEEFLVIAGLKVLRSAAHYDEMFAGLFWQYQKIRNTIYRHFVNRPMTPGLQWFVRHFGRLSRAKKVFTTTARVRSAASVSGAENGLRSLEVRTSPPESRDEAFALVSQLFDFARRKSHQSRGRHLKTDQTNVAARQTGPSATPLGLTTDQLMDQVRESSTRHASDTHKTTQWQTGMDQPPMEVGIVFHIVRDRGGGASRGHPGANGIGSAGAHPNRKSAVLSDATANFSFTPRFAKFVRQQLKQVRHLTYVIERYPLALQVVRGFDACTDELGIPTWAIVPLFDELRLAAARAKESLRLELGHIVPLPRTSVHVGEDFIHILTGLRQIDEAIEFLDLREGDRLGHALALGLEAAEWCTSAGDITMPVEQRLFDLVWEWQLQTTMATRADARRLHFLRSSIHRLSAYVFGASSPLLAPRSARPLFSQWPPGPEMLSKLRASLAQPHLLRKVGFFEYSSSFSPYELENEDELLLYVFLFQREVFRNLQSTIVVNSRAFAQTHAEVQSFLRHKVERMDIAIEVNPSSNLSVGDIEHMSQHPLWQLNSPRFESADHAIPLTIGSDDPITFSSDLRQEYQKLADALAAQGFSETAALEWLNRVRETGMRYRFTIPWERWHGRRLTDFRSFAVR